MEAGLARPAVSLSPALPLTSETPTRSCRAGCGPAARQGGPVSVPGGRWPRALAQGAGVSVPSSGACWAQMCSRSSDIHCSALPQHVYRLLEGNSANNRDCRLHPCEKIMFDQKPFVSSLFHIFSSLKETFYSGPNF